MPDESKYNRGLTKSLNFRLTLFVSLILLAAIGLFSYMMTHLEHDELITEVINGSKRFSEGIKRSTRYAMLKFDREAMHQILEQVGRQEDIERVRILNKEGEVIISTLTEEIGCKVDKQEEACYGCHEVDKPLERLPMSRRWRLFGEPGNRYAGIVDPIYNEPDCYNAACHVHSEERKVLGVLDVIVSLKEVNKILAVSAWRRAVFTLATIVVVGLVIGYYLYRAVSMPVRRLVEGTELIASGNLDYQIPTTSTTELGSLACSFNQMGRQLKETYKKLQGKIEATDKDLKKAYEELQEKQEQLVQAAKLSSLGELAAGVAHEINNPLATITLYAQMIRDELTNEQKDTKEEVDIILKHTTRTAGIVKNLLEFARRTDLETKPININPVLEEALSVTSHQAELQQANVAKELSDGLPKIAGDANKLQQVFVNIIVNALQVMQDGGKLTVRSGITPDNKCVRVSIRDTGPGIPEDVLAKIFEPFFTTKPTGKGTGLGLSVSHGIVRQHDGELEVESEVGKGTEFIITIPIFGGE